MSSTKNSQIVWNGLYVEIGKDWMLSLPLKNPLIAHLFESLLSPIVFSEPLSMHEFERKATLSLSERTKYITITKNPSDQSAYCRGIWFFSEIWESNEWKSWNRWFCAEWGVTHCLNIVSTNFLLLFKTYSFLCLMFFIKFWNIMHVAWGMSIGFTKFHVIFLSVVHIDNIFYSICFLHKTKEHHEFMRYFIYYKKEGGIYTFVRYV